MAFAHLNQLNKPVRIGIDLMGSDTPSLSLVSSLLELDKEELSASFWIFGTPSTLQHLPSHFHKIACETVVEMHDHPLTAFKTKKSSSLITGLHYALAGHIDAFITAANTGSTVLAAKRIIQTLPGIHRPALLAQIPTTKHSVVILDVGANPSLKPFHFLELAHLGCAYQKALGIPSPAIGLLNIGSEPTKGTLQHKQAFVQLSQMRSEKGLFKGNIEGCDVFTAKVDVVVTDGFNGNIFLKAAEGFGSFLFDHLFSLPEKTAQMHATFESMKQKLDPKAYPGAVLCGLKKLVLKCHGHVTPLSLKNTVYHAIKLLQTQLLEKLTTAL